MPQDDEQESTSMVVTQSNEAVKILLEKAPDIFYRNGQLIDVKFFSDAKRERPLTKALLVSHLARFVDWDKSNKNEAAGYILNHSNLEVFPALNSIHTMPVLRPDFTLIPAGYDKSTGILYRPSDAIAGHKFNLKPTQSEARAAYEKLLYPFGDFPIVSKAGTVNAVAFVLTMVSRTATTPQHDGGFIAPILAIKANGQSNGKSLIAKAISWCAQGKTSKDVLFDKLGEVDKTVRAFMVNHEKLIHVDNVTGVFKSPLIASLATSENPTVRVFGSLNLPQLGKDTLFVLNGNALKVDSDISKRLIFLEMWHKDPASRNPHGFQVFKDHHVDLMEYLKTNWIEYYDAAMTIIQAWRVAGMPKREPYPKLDKYNGWVTTIGGMLEFCGAKEFLADHAERFIEADDEKQQIVDFFKLVAEKFPDSLVLHQGVSVESLAGMLMTEWKGVLTEVQRPSLVATKQALGAFLKTRCGSEISGWTLNSKRKPQKMNYTLRPPSDWKVAS